MSEPRDILIIITPGFPASEDDSTCLPMQQQLVRAINRIHPNLQVIILSLQYPYIISEYSWHDNRVISFNGRNRGGLAGFMIRRKAIQALAALAREGRIVGMLSFWYGECARVGNAFNRLNGTPHYCWILGQDARKANRTPRIMRMKDESLVALSDFLQAEFQRNHNTRPAHVIPPGVDRSMFRDTSPARDIPRAIDIMAAGSLIVLKQYSVLLEVIAGLKKSNPNINAVIAGEGSERKRLEAEIDTMGLAGQVKLTGSLPYPEVLDLMRRSKVFLHPSTYEGFSGVCLEAASLGASVIS
ncbi:MAG TPA: glycosyltransferase, partial [Chitinophagaceae bacterium]|nr:glycosyltransferase [Chitinophagaceae bacterium]